ncbi:MAG: diadenylate cyclase, partial [Phycisphaerales bacterium]|nr:diadenylate cyclase [Phycisphaerales bacterium]
PTDLGSRHRAGVGLSLRCDELVIIISEQTGNISFADHGKLISVERDDLETELMARLNPGEETLSELNTEDTTKSNPIAEQTE